MPVKMNGATSGYTQIQAAAVAGNNTLTLPTSGTNLLADNGSGALTIQTINSGTSNALTLQSNNATAMYIDTSQNVGIGTSSPSSGAIVKYLDISNATSSGLVLTAVNKFSIYSSSSSSLVFRDDTAAVNRMILDSSGFLTVGSANQTYTNARIYAVSNSASVPAGYLATNVSGDVGTTALYVSKYDNNTTTSQIFVKFNVNNNANGSGQINANGASAAAFGTWSDERLKENIVSLPPQLANICALRPVEFDYKDGSGHQIGFIAQEMQQIYPDVVGEREDKMLTVTGWSKTEARLVAAIQELSAKLDAQSTDIAALKAKVGA